jgi:hypothetical protein
MTFNLLYHVMSYDKSDVEGTRNDLIEDIFTSN